MGPPFRGFPPSRTLTLACHRHAAGARSSMRARLGGSRLGLAFGLLVCSTLALYEEPPGGCAGPADDDLLQPPKAIQRSPRPPPPKAPPPAEPDEDDSQAELQRQVCVCVCRPALPFDRCPPEPHARDSAVLVAAARARPRPRPNPTAPTLALAPALAEALAGVRARVCGAAGGGGGGLGCDREGAQPRAPGEAGPPGRRDVLDGVGPALPSGLRVRWRACTA